MAVPAITALIACCIPDGLYRICHLLSYHLPGGAVYNNTRCDVQTFECHGFLAYVMIVSLWGTRRTYQATL